MKKIILKAYSTQELWNEILSREKYLNPDIETGSIVWIEVFDKVPELKHWLKRRELNLLRGSLVSGTSGEFIKGQIFENRFWQLYDKGTGGPNVPADPVKAKKLKSKVDFLEALKTKK